MGKKIYSPCGVSKWGVFTWNPVLAMPDFFPFFDTDIPSGIRREQLHCKAYPRDYDVWCMFNPPYHVEGLYDTTDSVR